MRVACCRGDSAVELPVPSHIVPEKFRNHLLKGLGLADRLLSCFFVDFTSVETRESCFNPENLTICNSPHQGPRHRTWEKVCTLKWEEVKGIPFFHKWVWGSSNRALFYPKRVSVHEIYSASCCCRNFTFFERPSMAALAPDQMALPWLPVPGMLPVPAIPGTGGGAPQSGATKPLATFPKHIFSTHFSKNKDRKINPPNISKFVWFLVWPPCSHVCCGKTKLKIVCWAWT